MNTPADPTSYIRATLDHFEPFSSAEAPTLEILCQGARLRGVVAGELFVNRGDQVRGLYLVARGEVKLFLGSSSGSERILRLASIGDTFCEESVFSDAAQTLSAQAVRDTTLIHLPERVLQLAMRHDARFAQALMRKLASRLAETVASMEQCEQRNGAQRVAHYLINNASRASDAIEVKLSTTKQTIASQLNMTPESLSRVLARLSREGYIHCRGHRAIRLTDVSGLQHLAA